MLDEPIDPDERADWLVEQGRVDEAITILEARARGGDWLDVDRLTDLLMENGRVEEAEAHWRAAIEAGLPWAYGGFADMLANAGRIDEAIIEYRAAIAAGDSAAGAGLAEVYVRAGQLDEAVHAYRSAIGAEGVSRWPLGALFEKLGRADEAEAAYRAAVDAGEGHVRERLMRLLAVQGRLEEATQLVRDMLAEPGHNLFYRQLGWLLTEQRRFEEIEAEALLLMPSNPIGLFYLLAGTQQSANYHEDCAADCKCSARVVRHLPGRLDAVRRSPAE